MRAWVVHATRKLPTAPGDKPLCELRVAQVPVAHLAPLELALNAKSVNEPSWFLTADGAAIINTLSSIGVVPLHCRVKFLKRSMDRVYLLNLPVAATGGPFKVLSGHNDASLALEVVGGGRFVLEADALRRIAVSAKVPGFYALGAAPSSTTVWFGAIPTEASFSVPENTVNSEDCWWSKDYDSSAGVIIMRAASSLQPIQSDRAVVVDGVRRTLRVAHELDIVHTDIRRGNILSFDAVPGVKFSAGWQLIDFGLSARAGSNVTILVASNRGTRCGVRIRKLLYAAAEQGVESATCAWTAEDDDGMLDGLELHV
jgi:hypothetical protein